MIKILTVCLGNICRSPAAEGLLRQALCEGGLLEGQNFQLDSAGTGDWHVGHAPDLRSQAVCQSYGLDISTLRARQIEMVDFERFDLILGMDQSNMENLKHLSPPEYHLKIKLFASKAVTDPYYGGDEGFETMYWQLKEAAEEWEKFVKL